MNDPITPVYTTLILIVFPVAVAYLVDYLYTVWDRLFPKELKYRE
jgi:hypothetical protein